MLRVTSFSLRRARGYENRVMYYSYRRQRIRYLPPKAVHAKNPLANKQPEEYGNTWDQRTGPEWWYRMRHRNEYRHWPWVSWKDDPLGTGAHARSAQKSRTFSVMHRPVAGADTGKPSSNLYPMVGQDYRVPSHYPLRCMAPFIALYTNKVWTKEELVGYLEAIEQQGWATIEASQKHFREIKKWNNRHHRVPQELLIHIRQLGQDMLQLNEKKAFRVTMQEKGILRTNEMTRYFALPYLRSGPAMPVVLAQPSGKYPLGAYNTMNGETVKIHPAYTIDGKYSRAMYPY